MSTWRLLNEFLSEIFSWDSKLFHTVGHLLFAPGLLTEEYAKGRHARYLSPFRLYLYTSAAMFYLLSLQVSHLPVEIPAQAAKGAMTDAKATSAVVVGISESKDGPVVTPEQYLKEQASKPVEERDPAIVRSIVLKTLSLRKVSSTEIVRRITTGAVQNAPKAMFVLLPVFAVLLKIVYLRRGRLYVEHLVLALHCHAFLFFVMSVAMTWQLLSRRWGLPGQETNVRGWLLLLMGVYLLAAMKRVYGQGWIKTSIKLSILAVCYSVLFTATLAAVVVYSLLTA